jgi:translation initiation factor IF-3
MFRGREQSRPELGYKLLQRLAQDIGDKAIVESAPLQDGRNMTMVLGPARRKSSEKSKTPKTTSSVEAEVQPAGDEDAKE